jgi:hypothetical protein
MANKKPGTYSPKSFPYQKPHMNPVYIQFEMPIDTVEKAPSGIWKTIPFKIFRWILYRIFPIANPDFDKKIDDVRIWLLEFDSNNGTPTREIGLDANEQVIAKMPYNENYGYWTDNNMTLKDFSNQFQVIEISQDFFEQKWALLT